MVASLDPYKKTPEWDVLETNHRSARAVMKPFSRPLIMKDAEGIVIGNDITENAMLFFQTVWAPVDSVLNFVLTLHRWVGRPLLLHCCAVALYRTSPHLNAT